MLKKTANLYAYLSICISCFFVSIGLALLVGTNFGSSLDAKQIMVQVFITAVSMTLLLYNRWTAIFAVFVGIGGVMYCNSLFKIDENGGLGSFLEWTITKMPENSQWYSPENVDSVHTLLNIVICVFIFVFGRTYFRSILVGLSAVAVIVLAYLNEIIEYNRIIILLIFLGVFSLFAVDKFEGRKTFFKKKTFKVLGQHWIVPVSSILICSLIAGITLIAFDNDKKYDNRNRFSSNIAADLQSYSDVYTNEQKSLDISLYSLGLQKNKKYIGGNLPKGKHNLLAITNLTKPTNVKIATFEKFDGRTWKTDFSDTYRVNGPFTKEQNQYLANNSLNNSKFLFALNNFVSSKKVNIMVTVDTMFLPTIGQTLSFTEKSDTKNPNLFNRSGQVFSFYGQKAGYKYTLETLNFNTKLNLTKSDVALLNSLAKAGDPNYTKSFVAKYTNSPFRFGEATELLFKELGITPDKNNYNTACKIMNYFSKENGYVYTTKGLKFDKKSNVVHELLQTKKGHCVYYSTAAIAILRHLNVPCRLAAGYRTVMSSKNIQIVDSYYPYCWVECYFPNLGWISFDPSPEHEIEFDSQLTTTLDNYYNSNPDIIADNKENTNISLFKIGKLPFGIIFALLGLAFVYLAIRGFWANKLYEYQFVLKRFKTTEKQLEYYLKDIERQISALGLVSLSEKTLREQSEWIYNILESDDREILDAAFDIFESFCYGNKTPSSDEIRYIYDARLMLEKVLKRNINPIKYIIKRKILLPVL